MRKSLAAIIVFATLNQTALAQEPSSNPVPHINVTGSASIEVEPDMAVIDLGVTTERKTAEQATAENACASEAVVKEIRNAGIEPRDIKTMSVTVMQVFDEERNSNGQMTKRTLRGYVARNSLRVTIHQIDKAGAIARRLIDAGANSFSGITFKLSNEREKRAELRALALKDAQERAKRDTEALGIKLGRVLTIDGDRAGYDADLPAKHAAPVTVPIPVEPGTLTLMESARVRWEIVTP